MGHLGARISALVDGQLSPQAAERALSHVSRCGSCRMELRAERKARQVVAQAGPDVPAPVDLTSRLLSLAAAPGLVTEATRLEEDDGAEMGARGPAGSPDAVPPQRGRGHARVLAVGACVSIVGLAGSAVLALSALGTSPVVRPDPQARTVFEIAGDDWGTAGTPSLADTAHDPGVTPAVAGTGLETAQTSISSPAPGVTAVVAHTAAGTAVIWRQQGTLDTGSLAGVMPTEFSGMEVRIVSRHPFHAVWQCGDEVVTLVSDLPQQQVARIVASLDEPMQGAGFLGHVARGWEVLGARIRAMAG